jgi:hypothetical protein
MWRAMLIALFILYSLAFPILVALDWGQVLEASASNWQRAMLNHAAIVNTLSTPFSMSETTIFSAAEEYRYSHDTEALTVHNLFWAFGLFNGAIPAALLFWAVIRNVVTTRGCKYASIAGFYYLMMILGPDVTATRTGLLVICFAKILAAQDVYPVRKVYIHAQRDAEMPGRAGGANKMS